MLLRWYVSLDVQERVERVLVCTQEVATGGVHTFPFNIKGKSKLYALTNCLRYLV